MELTKQLEKFGLNEKQAQLYLACLELGPTSVQSIAQKTGIKRTTIYDLLESLKSQNLITQTIKGKKKLLVAENPAAFKNILQEREKEFELILPELNLLHAVPGQKPRIKYFEGVEGIKRVLEDTIQGSDKLIRNILPIRSILEVVGEEFFDDYTQRRIKLGYSLHSIRPESKEIKVIVQKYGWVTSKKDRRVVRWAPKDFLFSMLMYLYGNKVSLVSSKKENFGMIIESEEFAYNQKALFGVLWKASKK